MSERRIEYMPLSKVKPAKRNVKGHDIGLLAQSVGRFGYADAVIIDERTGRLVAGHGRVETLTALKQRGSKAPDGLKTKAGEWLVPVQRGWASKNDREAEAFLMASNKTVYAGGWDDAALMEAMKDIAQSGGSFEGTGFDADELDQLIHDTTPLEFRSEAPTNPKTQLHQVVVTCPDEASKVELIKRLTDEGFGCRAAGSVTHGLSSMPEYDVWVTMRQRCDNPKSKDFPKYGGRGIRVCERWSSFEQFITDMGPKLPGTSLDRVDNEAGYSPENCRWRTFKEQANNRRPRTKKVKS